MTSIQGNGIDDDFPTSKRVQIAALSPDDAEVFDRYVYAQVVLIWPYSSSTRKFSLLLSEPDARPFKSRRQLKVTFHNGSARAVQDTHVGIGDKIKLWLAGCDWTRVREETSTPGKKLEFDAEFRKAVTLKVQPPDGIAKLIRYEATETPSPVRSPVSNVVLKVIEDINISTSKIALSYISPAGGRALSGSYLDSPLDPFAEDKEYVYGRSRKRTKFARASGAWTLLDDDEQETHEPETPSKAVQAQDPALDAPIARAEDAITNGNVAEVVDMTTPVVETFDEANQEPPETEAAVNSTGPPEAEQALSKAVVQEVMGPPQLPATARDQQEEVVDMEEEDVAADDAAVTTPRLGPLPSAGLALVSPLVQSHGRISYFLDRSDQSSELDAISRPSEHTVSEPAFSESGSSDGNSSEGSVLVVEPLEPQMPSPQMGVVQEERSSPASIATFEDSSVEDEAMPQEVESENHAQSVAPRASSPASVQEVQVIESEDEDMYGAPETALAKSVLDVFEEYVDMSQAAAQQQGHAEVTTTFTTPALALPDDTFAADESPAPAKSARRTSRRGSPTISNEEQEASAPQSLDGAVDAGETTMSQTGPILIGATKAELEATEHALVVPQQPMTPAPTQESFELPKQQERSFEVPPLLTPAPSRDLEHLLPDLPSDMQDSLETQEPPIISAAEKDSTKPRRVSQRLTRRSAAPEELASPYFTPRARKPRPPPTPIQTEHLATSSQHESDTSPISTRSQLKSPGPANTADGQVTTYAQEASPAASVPQHAQGIQTDIAYYTRLTSLSEHFGQLVDLIVVCAEDSTKAEKAKSGPKDFHTTIRLVDPSSPPGNTSKTVMQVFRPLRQAIPSARRGDVLILRDFKVQTAKRKCMLLSTESSAWAVFQTSPAARTRYDDVQINGPPVEYGRGETSQVKKLSQWWQEEGQAAYDAGPKGTHVNGIHADGTIERDEPSADAEPVSDQAHDTEPEHLNDADVEAYNMAAPSVERPSSPRRSRRQRNKTDNINNEDDQASVTEEAEENVTSLPPPSTRKQPPRRARTQTPHVDAPVPVASPTHRRARTKTPQVNGATSPTSPIHRRTRSTKSPSTVHELRDGTKYVDEIDGRKPNTVHELRDGSSYVDRS